MQEITPSDGRVNVLPSPPVPADLSLRHLPYMPLDVRAFHNSRIYRIGNAEEIGAAFRLWCAAWHEVPACSVPSDDRELAFLAGFGRDLDGWRRARDVALHGFVLCSDGRYYHDFLVQKAGEILGGKAAARSRAQTAAKSRWAEQQGKLGNNVSKQAVLDADALPEHSPCNANPMQSDAKGEGEGKGKGEVRESTGLVDRPPPELKKGDSLQQQAVERPPDLGLTPNEEILSPPEVAFQTWNRMAEESGLPRCANLTKNRQSHINARLKECDGLSGWDYALAKVSQSSFLKRPWNTGGRCDLDWVIKPDNFTKIMEGKYDDKPNGNANSENSDKFRRLFTEAARIYDRDYSGRPAESSGGGSPGGPRKLSERGQD